MARTSPGTLYECAQCGWRNARWAGRCGGCEGWGTLAERRPDAAPQRGAGLAARGGAASPPGTGSAVPLTAIDPAAAAARPTGLDELDRVLGGGFVPGTVALLAGEPGVGKSTLALEAAALAAGSATVLYVTGEESAAQVRQRAERIGAVSQRLFLAAATDLAAVLAHVDQTDPELLIIDSVQTVTAAGVEGAPGGVSQVREITAALVGLAKRRTMTTVLVGHVTKDGSIAGPRSLEHLVDIVLHFDGDSRGRLRMVRAMKNRFGPTDELGCFELGDFGLIGLPDPSGLFLSRRADPVPGTCVTVTLEGRRPLVAEVQALVAPAPAEPAKKVTSGLDSARVGMIIAVLQRRARVSLARQDIYAATIGGVRLTEPAADLAIALALAGGRANIAIARDLVAIGEVGLAGEIRGVTGIGRRLTEAERMGFRRAVVPEGADASAVGGGQLAVMQAADLTAAVATALGAADRPGPARSRAGT